MILKRGHNEDGGVINSFPSVTEIKSNNAERASLFNHVVVYRRWIS